MYVVKKKKKLNEEGLKSQVFISFHEKRLWHFNHSAFEWNWGKVYRMQVDEEEQCTMKRESLKPDSPKHDSIFYFKWKNINNPLLAQLPY